MLTPEPITLSGRLVRLEPLTRAHFAGLCDAGLDPRLWRFGMWNIRNKADLIAYLEEALVRMERGHAVPFVIIDKGTGTAVGSTRFADFHVAHSRLEIGATWIGVPWQRTGINIEAKLLMLEHAFEKLGAVRVQFRADSRNEQSRLALEGIGAVWEGALRQHMLTHDGVHRDTVYYSILSGEWPAVKTRLTLKLSR